MVCVDKYFFSQCKFVIYITHIVIFFYAWIRLKLFIRHDFKLEVHIFLSICLLFFFLFYPHFFYEASDQYVKCERALTHMQIGPLNGNLRPPSLCTFCFVSS